MPSKLKYPGELYQPTWKFLKENFTEAAMKREYSRLRDIAQKRLIRMGEGEFSKSATYEQNVGRFPVLKTFTEGGKISKKAEFAKALSQLSRFIESPISTTRGQRAVQKQTIATLQERGYTFVNAKNYWEFISFMEEARARKLDRTYDSDRIAQMFKAARKQNIPADVLYEDFDYYVKNKQYLSKIDVPERGSYSSKDLKAMIEEVKRK